MNDPRLSTIERAYQLARSGRCRGIDDIRRALTAERYEAIQGHLAGASIRQDLLALCRAAAPAAGDSAQKDDAAPSA
jgi:hypothetical protein